MSGYAAVSVGAVFTSICALGLYSEVSLYRFLKSGNLSAESKLVPWRSSTKKEDAGVPIRATTIGLISFVILIITVGMIWKSIPEGNHIGITVVLVIRLVWAISLQPMLLLFTVKNQKKRVGPQPPPKLQFHDEEMEQEEPQRIRDLKEGHFEEVKIDETKF